MMIYRIRYIVPIALVTTTPAMASVVEFTDKAEWESAVGGFTTLDFVLPPSSTPISDQYAHLGVNFSGVLFSHEAGVYLNDGWGLRSVSNTGGAWAQFDTPQNWIAVDHPGTIMFELFRDGHSIYQSSIFDAPGPSGVGGFAGLLLTEGFDTAYLHRAQPGSPIFIDDLHFGTLVPGPGGLALLALAGFAGRSRRRA